MSDWDERLLRAWASGDEAARQTVWSLFWQRYYQMACRFCSRTCSNKSMAEDCANDGLIAAIEHLERNLQSGQIHGASERSFHSLVTQCVIWRCQDRVRSENQRTARRSPDNGVTGSDPIEALCDERPDPCAILLGREGLRTTLRLLDRAHQACEDRPALASTLEEMRQFIHQALRAHTGAPDGYPLEKLLSENSFETLAIDRFEMNQHLMEVLHISRAALDQRMKHIHKLLRTLKQHDG